MVCFVFLADLVGWLVGWLVGAVSLPFALVEIDEMNEFQQGRNEARIVWGSGRQCFRGDETVTSHHKKRKSGRCVLAKQEKQEKKMSPKNKKTKTRNRHPPRAHECENTQRDKRHTCQFLCMMSCPKHTSSIQENAATNFDGVATSCFAGLWGQRWVCAGLWNPHREAPRRQPPPSGL